MALALEDQVVSPSLFISRIQNRPSSFNFVTISDPKDIRDTETQRTIRSNAGRIGARKRAKNSRPVTWTFELTGPNPSTSKANPSDDHAFDFTSTETTCDSSEVLDDIDGFQALATPMTTPIRSINPTYLRTPDTNTWQPFSGDINNSPLYGFTVPSDERSRLLFDFFLDYKSRFAYPFMAMCFTFALHDHAIIFFILATASTLYEKKVGHRVRSSDVEAASYKDSGLQIINSRLRSEVHNTSNETLCAVLAVACGEVCEAQHRC